MIQPLQLVTKQFPHFEETVKYFIAQHNPKRKTLLLKYDEHTAPKEDEPWDEIIDTLIFLERGITPIGNLTIERQETEKELYTVNLGSTFVNCTMDRTSLSSMLSGFCSWLVYRSGNHAILITPPGKHIGRVYDVPSNLENIKKYGLEIILGSSDKVTDIHQQAWDEVINQ